MNQELDRGAMTMRHQADPADLPRDAEALAALAVAGDAEPAPEARVPSLARHGRGATLNPPVRYASQVISAFDDAGTRWAPSFPSCRRSPPP